MSGFLSHYFTSTRYAFRQVRHFPEELLGTLRLFAIGRRPFLPTTFWRRSIVEPSRRASPATRPPPAPTAVDPAAPQASFPASLSVAQAMPSLTCGSSNGPGCIDMFRCSRAASRANNSISCVRAASASDEFAALWRALRSQWALFWGTGHPIEVEPSRPMI